MSARSTTSARNITSIGSTTSARDATSIRARKGVYKDSFELQVTLSTSRRAEVEEIDLERDAEVSGKTPEPVKEPSPETEKTDSYQRYVMTGKGDTPEQKVNEAVKELNYHNMLVVIAVGDKTINNITIVQYCPEGHIQCE